MKSFASTTGAGAGRGCLALAMLFAGLIPAGCGSSGMSSVSGTVTALGKPVPMGTIGFLTTNPAGRNATGLIQSDGSYTLQTENPGDGALPGEYNVTVSAREEVVLDYIPKKPIPPKFLAPAKYEKPETSGLKAKVVAGSNRIDFDLPD